MSNVKDVKIVGDLDTMGVAVGNAANWDDPPAIGLEVLEQGHNIAKADLKKAIKAAGLITSLLAQSVFPDFGLKVRFLDKGRYAHNGYNGLVQYFNYEISGQEAISYGYFENLVAALKVFGEVKVRAIRDLEA